jgi:hypothetical protein
LHGDTSLHRRSSVVACEGEQDVDKTDTEQDCFSCRYANGNTYPYMRNELFKFVFEYQVPSLANPRKMVGTNQVDFSDTDYSFIVENQIGSMGNDVEAFIDFDSNKAKLITKEIGFTLNEVITILNSMKSNDTGEGSSLGEYARNLIFDEQVDKKIKQLKRQYNGEA